ncbi:MAG: dihydrolipoamide acetyltransferase family protein [Myxococcaceae bacterium]
MATFEFKLPDIGEGVVEGEIVKWLVKEGDAIKEDQPMVEVMTDKATVTIPSPKKGKVMKTFGKEGEIAKVHHALVLLEVDGAGGTTAAPATGNGHSAPAPAAKASAPRPPPLPVKQAPASAVATSPSQLSTKVLATPVTRRMAREHGIDLARVSGSGPQGRVTKADVEAVLGGGGAPASTGVQQARASSAPLHTVQGDQRVPIRGLRKRIADKMVKSKFTAPHYTFVEEIDATALVEAREKMNAALKKIGDDTKISFLPFFCKALIGAFREFPEVNSNMDEATQELIVRGEYNIGIAAATPQGLTVPVVKHVDRLSMRALAAEIARLGNAARDGKLKMDELTGGTFTVTSLGQTGGLFATPIINHPETAIMGVHKMRKRPMVDEDTGEIVVRQMMYLSFSFDHRVIDGAVGADFAYAVLKYLVTPELLLLEMA